jgi:hypothetical protein
MHEVHGSIDHKGGNARKAMLVFRCNGRVDIPQGKAQPAYLSVIQRFHILCDRSEIRIRRDDLEVAATNSFAPQFAHFGYRLATDKAAELGDETSLTSDE